MKRPQILFIGLMLLSFPSLGESLSAYYLRFVSSASIGETIEKLVYVFCGLGALVSLGMVFSKMANQDYEASQRAQQWCLSLVLIAGVAFLISTLLDDARSVSQINIGGALEATTTQLRNSFGSLSNLVYVGCGLAALIVLPGKFRALQAGDRYAEKGVASWCFGLVSVVCITYVARMAFFS